MVRNDDAKREGVGGRDQMFESEILARHGRERRLPVYSKHLAIIHSLNLGKKELERKMEVKDILILVLAILLPPLAVFLLKGCGKDLCINIILCFFFWLPGIIHALWVAMQGSG